MATSLLQKARQRKMIYFGAIVALFTVSLIHREFIVKPQATRLQLRETSRGEVELTSSAVRLLLSGSRGIAVTMLWHNAIEKQKRNEYHELELIVKSITKLQPYFITPWLFQGWNIAFNVSVQCDRPRDKYYYISRGVELLAEGERRNSGTEGRGAAAAPDLFAIPGNPEMRQFIGLVYQLKIGNSDERLTMRSLLEMSCIDPVQRNPDRFWTTTEKGRKGVNMVELANFSQKYPRLVRRLQEQLDYSDPQRIVQFLQDHQNIPNRYKPIEKAQQAGISESALQHPLDQFPILPPHQGKGPDPQTRDLSTESVDVFLICRTWFEYSQKPLPPPDRNPGPQSSDYDKLKHRVPKGMVTQLFRQHPVRAQLYIAETLDSEGFFDSDGWDATDWFQKKGGRQAGSDVEHHYGTDPKYHSHLAWKRSHVAVKYYGEENGIYLSADEIAQLNNQAELIRRQPNFHREANPELKAEWRQGELGKSLDADRKLFYSSHIRTITNFDSFLYQTEAESDAIMVAVRKKLFQAERKRRILPELSLELYEEAWDLYMHVGFRHPNFSQVKNLQEDIYEVYQNSLGVSHVLYRDKFKSAVILAAKVGFPQDWQEAMTRFAVVSEAEKDEPMMKKIFPIRTRFGALDRILYFDGRTTGPGRTGTVKWPSKELKEEFLFKWVQGAGLAQHMSVASAFTYPGHEYFLLTRRTDAVEDLIPERWLPLVNSVVRTLSPHGPPGEKK